MPPAPDPAPTNPTDPNDATDPAAAPPGAAWPPAGFVDRDGAARMFGVAPLTFKNWVNQGKIPCARWSNKPTGARCYLFAIEDLRRLKAEMEAARPRLPEGFIGQDEAARLCAVTPLTFRRWEREGVIRCGRWGRSPTNKPCRIYPVAELERAVAELRSADKVHREPGERRTYTYHVPEGFVRYQDAWEMFGVDRATFHRWELEGKITCGARVSGAGPKIYPVDALNRLLAECGKYAPPYPDPERPGCYRVPLNGRDIRRREAVIDAADLPLVAGKRCHWSERGPDEHAQVVVWDGRQTVRLRQLIMGVSGVEWRVGHRNGDPLDCRRANLFVRTKQEQAFGSRKMKAYAGQPCSSRFKGVCFEKRTGRWRAAIVVDGKTIRLGRFRDELAAAEAYDEAARELFGEHARLNFPDGIDAFLEAEGARAERAEAA